MTQPVNPYDGPQIGGGLTMPGAPPPPSPGQLNQSGTSTLNTSGLSLGGGLSLPTNAAGPLPGPVPVAPAAPVLPASVGRDLRANERDASQIRADVSEDRRTKLEKDLVRYGSTRGLPGSEAPTGGPATGATGAFPGGVPNTASPISAHYSPGAAPGGEPYDYYKHGRAPAGRYGKEYDHDVAVSDEAQAHELQAGDELAKLQAQQQDAHADASQIALAHYNAGVLAAQKDRQIHEAETKALSDKIEATRDDLSKDKIDPNRLYGDHLTPGKLLASIAIGMGAFDASRNHHENFAQGIINDKINRDIEAQKAAHANKVDNLKGAINLYDRHRQEGLDHQTAENATHLDLLHNAMQMGDAQAEKSGSPIMQAKWQQTRAGLAAQFADKKKDEDISINLHGYQRRQQELAAEAAANAVNPGVAKEEIADQDSIRAAGHLASQPEGELAGYGVGGRFRHWISEKTGVDLESDEAKENREATRVLEAQRMKATAQPTRGTAIDENLNRFVRNEHDARALSSQALKDAKLRHQLAKVTGGKGTHPGGGRGIREQDEEEP